MRHMLKKMLFLKKNSEFQVPIALDLCREFVLGEQSSYKPYLDILPKEIVHPVTFERVDFDFVKDSTAYGACLGLFYEVYCHYAQLYRKVGFGTVFVEFLVVFYRLNRIFRSLTPHCSSAG